MRPRRCCLERIFVTKIFQTDRPTALIEVSHPGLESDSKPTFYFTLILIFLMQAGLTATVPPTISILQELICVRYYTKQNSLAQGSLSTAQRDCKAEPIQAELTMLKGIATLLLLL